MRKRTRIKTHGRTHRLSITVPANVATAMAKLAEKLDVDSMYYVSLGRVYTEGALLLLKKEGIDPSEQIDKMPPEKQRGGKRQRVGAAA